ncbi:MAG: NAD(+) synthase, partial [Firmicutes bacterium]|nr:NAD(+) synthase [Bacillota bacterium]
LGSLKYHPQLLQAANNVLKELVAFSKSLKLAFIVSLPMFFNGSVQTVARFIQNGRLCELPPEKLVFLCDSDYNDSFTFSVVFGDGFNLNLANPRIYDYFDADLILNLASSPVLIDSFKDRKNKIAVLSKLLSCAYTYVSIGGAAHETVFSGDKIVGEMGEVIAHCKNDTEDIVYAEIDMGAVTAEKREKTTQADYYSQARYNLRMDIGTDAEITRQFNPLPFVPEESEFARIYDIVARGIYTRMQVAKSKKIILGLSGGLDSAMTLIATEKAFRKYNLDPKDILCVMLPTINSSTRTKNNAAKLVELLGVTGIEIPIQETMDLHFKNIGHKDKTDIVYENAQARERTQILLDLANKNNALMLGTGDLSEIALGWSTYGGDQLAQYNPNSSMAKTLIRALIQYESLVASNKNLAKVLDDILGTPVSPELLANQDTEKTLGPYELHDFFLYHLIARGGKVEKVFAIAAKTFNKISKKDILAYLKLFITRFFSNQFKRTSSCDGIQLTEFDLSYKVIHSEFNGEVFLKEVERLEKEVGK